MYHAHKTALARPQAANMHLDVMDFIFEELVHAVYDKKAPVYAPFIMKLIVTKMPDLAGRLSTKHKVKRLQIKLAPEPSAPSGGPSGSPPRARRKSATPGGTSSLIDPPSPPTKVKVKKPSWFERTMLCMQISVHQENYEA